VQAAEGGDEEVDAFVRDEAADVNEVFVAGNVRAEVKAGVVVGIGDDLVGEAMQCQAESFAAGDVGCETAGEAFYDAGKALTGNFEWLEPGMVDDDEGFATDKPRSEGAQGELGVDDDVSTVEVGDEV
jgi:hypothetical protein